MIQTDRSNTTHPIAFVGATVIDGTGHEPIQDSIVLIRDSCIEQVGNKSQIKLPEDCETVDVSGMTIMPGMFDCHTHVAYTYYSLEKRLATPRTVEIFQTARNMGKLLHAGFTTIRVPGPRVDPGFRLAVEMGLFEGPRLIVASRLAPIGGHFDSYHPAGIQLPLSDAQICTGVTEVQAATRRIIREGYDFIKICTTGDLQDPPEDSQWTAEELKAIVVEASARGKAVMAHAQGTQGIKNAIRAGVWSVEHGGRLDDEAIQMFLDTGTYLVPTLFIVEDIQVRGDQIGLPTTQKHYREFGHFHTESFRRAVAAGIKIAVGTDALDENAHGRNARELELMVLNGMTPMQAIVAATKTSSEVCRVNHKVGTLEPHKLADLLVVKGNPLEDISILQDQDCLLVVMKEGRKFVNRL